LFPVIENIEVDFLLIKTGYGNYRGADYYTLTPPGLSSELAGYFRQEFPNLRCVGMDLISTSSFSNREEGRKAHQAFLNLDKGEPILLIEDMKLDEKSPFKKVLVAPLLIENAEGVSCTVFAYT
jgi:kynurenine formamidase